MLTYAKLALIGLQIVQFLLRKINDAQQFDAGEEHQIAEQAKAVLGMVAEGKRLLEKLDALPDRDLDDITDAIGSAR